MQTTKKMFKLMNARKKMALLALISFSLASEAHARNGSQFINISVSGSLNKDIQEFVTSSRRSLGLEIGLPITDILEVIVAHTQILDRDEYNEAYRSAKKEQGVTLPDGTIEQKTQILDYSANAAIGYSFGYLKPTLFGGALKRRSCLEDTFQDYGCNNQNVTWNAGIALSTYITAATRFRVSYRLSPSVYQDGVKKDFDELVSIGLTWSL